MKYKEDDLQKAVANYLDFKNVLWCHVANERKTTPASGKRLKEKGVKSGVPDCLIFEAMGEYHGLAIELKIKPNKPTDNQLRWLSQLRENGWYTCVCYSSVDVVKVVEEYLLLKKQ